MRPTACDDEWGTESFGLLQPSYFGRWADAEDEELERVWPPEPPDPPQPLHAGVADPSASAGGAVVKQKKAMKKAKKKGRAEKMYEKWWMGACQGHFFCRASRRS